MSKRNIVIAAVLVIAGAAGMIYCFVPSVSKQQEAVNKYIDAIDNCDMEGIKESMPLEQIEDSFDIDTEEFFDSYEGELTTKLDYLKFVGLSASDKIPEDAKEVEEISLISTEFVSSDESNESATDSDNDGFKLSNMSSVDAAVKVTYVSADDETVDFTSLETFLLMETSDGYKIMIS